MHSGNLRGSAGKEEGSDLLNSGDSMIQHYLFMQVDRIGQIKQWDCSSVYFGCISGEKKIFLQSYIAIGCRCKQVFCVVVALRLGGRLVSTLKIIILCLDQKYSKFICFFYYYFYG